MDAAFVLLFLLDHRGVVVDIHGSLLNTDVGRLVLETLITLLEKGEFQGFHTELFGVQRRNHQGLVLLEVVELQEVTGETLDHMDVVVLKLKDKQALFGVSNQRGEYPE